MLVYVDLTDSFCRFMNWALMNHYDEKGEMIMPRPRGKEADEQKFTKWVRVVQRDWIVADMSLRIERRPDRVPVSVFGL